MTSQRSMVSVGIMVLAAFAIVSCSGTNNNQEQLLSASSDGANDDLSFSMAADGLDRLQLETGTAVVVPSDRALLDLDADDLARLARRDGLDDLLRRYRVRSDFDSLNMRDAILVTEDGDVLQMDLVDGRLMLGNLPYLGLIERNGVTVILVDGVPEGPY